MRRIHALIAAALPVGAVGLALAAPPAHADYVSEKRSCNSINLGEPRIFFKHNMRCSSAKHYARRLYKTDGQDLPRNFTCESGSDFNEGGACRHDFKNKYFGWHPADKRKAADIYVYDTTQHFKQEPDRVVLDGMPGPWLFSKVRPWRNWGAFKTRSAMGKMRSQDCDPSCAEGGLERHRARLILSNPRTCHGRRVYGKAVLAPKKGGFSPAGIDDPDLFQRKLRLEITCEGYVQPW